MKFHYILVLYVYLTTAQVSASAQSPLSNNMCSVQSAPTCKPVTQTKWSCTISLKCKTRVLEGEDPEEKLGSASLQTINALLHDIRQAGMPETVTVTEIKATAISDSLLPSTADHNIEQPSPNNITEVVPGSTEDPVPDDAETFAVVGSIQPAGPGYHHVLLEPISGWPNENEEYFQEIGDEVSANASHIVQDQPPVTSVKNESTANNKTPKEEQLVNGTIKPSPDSADMPQNLCTPNETEKNRTIELFKQTLNSSPMGSYYLPYGYEILQVTRKISEEGQYQFEMVFPSGNCAVLTLSLGVVIDDCPLTEDVQNWSLTDGRPIPCPTDNVQLLPDCS